MFIFRVISLKRKFSPQHHMFLELLEIPISLPVITILSLWNSRVPFCGKDQFDTRFFFGRFDFFKYCTFSDHFGQNLASHFDQPCNFLNFVFSKCFADPDFLKNQILICFIFHEFLASVARQFINFTNAYMYFILFSLYAPRKEFQMIDWIFY